MNGKYFEYRQEQIARTPDEVLDASYPEGNYAIMEGCVFAGFRFWGPFKTMRLAIDFVKERQPLIGNVSIVPIKDPADHPIHTEQSQQKCITCGEDGYPYCPKHDAP